MSDSNSIFRVSSITSAAKKLVGKDMEGSDSSIVEEGQLAVDVYETDNDLVVIAPIAGVKKEDLEIILVDDLLTIKGKRGLEEEVPEEQYFNRECFFGDFSRSILLPQTVQSKKIRAKLKNGVLKLTIPKQEEAKPKVIQIDTEE